MTINNVAYSWSMVQLTSAALTGSTSANPTILAGVVGIKWSRKWHVETNYGLGGKPHTRGFGNWEYSASITMDYNTQVQLRALNGGLTNLGEFDLIISFSNELGTEDFGEETITLKQCIFTEDGMEVSQDDTNITQEFDLNPIDIIISSEVAGGEGA